MFSINTTTEYNLTVFDNTTSRYDNAFVEKMNHVISLSLIVVTFIAMMSLGCTMEVSKIKKYLIKPKGVAIAAVAQYGIMPLTAFCLAKLLQLGPLESITVLICGCCPGGNLSNFFALALQGDINLSIVMTTCSTVMGLGLMPLMIYLYCQGFSNLERAVPYTSIIISMILILVPCGVGILINYHFPKYSKIITKVGISVMLILFVVIGVVAGVIDGNRVFRVTAPPLLATAALMPMIGYICGYILSTLFKMNASCRRTIAIETGCQNIQLCTTILKVAFPAEVIGQLYLFPVVYIVFQVVEALFLVVLFRCHQMLRPSDQETEMYKAVKGAAEETNAAHMIT
ncbi:hepatic sodium/bile acid cotransporter [Triplophysa rosa]|uniref:hepatic sodium/bile acid cotransporter n=1 Tax=Triplophysa rosa TaxID=992332 RepID=UPI0025462113|nr:hepatic sodium/bile acid cotransporter [Triplophysa rosa]XP_057208358.1 hepatic sodium/bile acid cotransporter [Triplophysa rosa]